MHHSKNLNGQVALVTGASGGIGAAIAVRLALEEAKVVVNYNSGAASAKKIVAEITASGGEAIALKADVSDGSQVASMIELVMDRWQRIDILVNNAGIRKDKLLMRLPEADWDSVINVNLRSAYLCSKAVLPHMVRQRSGRIICISSVVGLSGNPGQANYAASKSGLIGLTKTIAREVASRNITANALAPGYIVTKMVDDIPEELKSQILSNIPLHRFGSADDVASLVAFLSSSEAAYITGQIISVDGGLTT